MIAIAAVDNNWAIGLKDQLLVKIPSDMKNFRKHTLNHVVVPDLAIDKRAGSGDRFVYVYKDGKVRYSKVELGQRLGDRYELISGVPNGAQIVITGMAKLADGKEVEVVE